MSDETRKKLHAVLVKDIVTPTPYLSLNGPQGGRSFLVLNAAERQEVIARVERIVDAR